MIAQNRYAHFEEGALIGTMLGAARMLAGGEPEAAEGDLLYPGLLVTLSVLVVAALVLLVWTFARIAKGPKPDSRKGLVIAGSTCWVVVAALVAYVSWVAVPGLAPSRTVFFLLAPDVAWLLAVLGATAVLVAAARIWHGLARLRARSVGTGPGAAGTA